MSDLYDEEPDLFVAGMAAGNHRVGVFSFCRYDPNLKFSSEFWYKVLQQFVVHSVMTFSVTQDIVLNNELK